MTFKPIRYINTLFGKKTTAFSFPPDFDLFHIEIIRKVRPYTMTSPERLFALIEAVKYVVTNNIPGSFVECGVWKGGSMMAIAETLHQLKVTDRQLYLYDTFAGMPPPTEEDKNYSEETAASMLKKEAGAKEDSVVWAYSNLAEVKANISQVTYPAAHIHFIEGDVLQTIPSNDPGQIALLRLDTDWYESTRHELVHLYPKLISSGVLIIDDYGYWKGSRKAVDEYMAANHLSLLLNRIDDTGRSAIKP
eukprot:Opistho-1_new@33883